MLLSIWARGNRKSAFGAPTGRFSRRNAGQRKDLDTYLAGRPTSRVIVETCAEAFCVADAARKLGHETRVVPATLVKTLGVGARRLKTDLRDARALSEVSSRIDLPSVHIPRTESRDRKTMCGMREALIGARTKIINTVRGWLRSRGRRIERGGKASLRQRVEVAWEGQLPSYVDRQLKLIEVLNTQIAEADAEVKSWATTDETCTRLMTVPGVGPLTALRFVAALDDVTRFESAHQVESYLGLVPGESSSSERQQRLSITKAGPRALRWVLVQAAWALHLRCRRPEAIPLQLWAHRIEQRRGRRTAIIALARKLAGILFALWRDGSVYEGSRGAKMI